MGFFLGPKGYIFVEGPGGTSGHKITARGFDGVAYNHGTRHLIIYDNKAFGFSGNVSSATSIDLKKNLAGNLNRLIQKINKMMDLPNKHEILDLLCRTRASIEGGTRWPTNVQIAISNASGQSSGVSQRLARSGIEFIDYQSAMRTLRGE